MPIEVCRMSPTSVVERVTPSLEVLRVEGPQRMEALGQPVDAIIVTIRRQINEEAMLALSSVDLANCLGYANKGSRAIRSIIKRHAKELNAWVVTGAELKKHAPERIIPPLNERVWVVGPGLDLILMFSAQPKAVDFRAWLSERSLELRTKGVTYAAPELQRSAEASADSRATEMAARVLERTLALLERVEARLSAPPPAPALPPPPEPRFIEGIGERLPDGWLTAEQLARRVGWMSAASAGKLPHPRAVFVAALNDGFDLDPDAFAIRDRVVDTPDGPKAVPQKVFTRRGVERFLRVVVPLYRGRDSFVVEPNYRALRSGQRGRQSVVRRVDAD